MRDERTYLTHILDCIARVARYTASGRAVFLTTDYWQDAVIRNLQVLAESTQRLTVETKATHPEIAWRQISRFRNVATHNYLNLDWEAVWDITQIELPPLKTAIMDILQSLPEEPPVEPFDIMR